MKRPSIRGFLDDPGEVQQWQQWTFATLLSVAERAEWRGYVPTKEELLVMNTMAKFLGCTSPDNRWDHQGASCPFHEDPDNWRNQPKDRPPSPPDEGDAVVENKTDCDYTNCPQEAIVNVHGKKLCGAHGAEYKDFLKETP